MSETEQTIHALARFESLFHRDNLKLGASIWLRTNLPIFLVAIPLSLLPISAELFLGIGIALMVILFQRAAGREAARLYGIPVSPWCWWSINWRVAVYLLPLTIVMAMMLVSAYPDFDDEAVGENPGPLAAANFIHFVVSIVPMGLATSQAFLVSMKRHKEQFGEGGSQGPGGE